MLLIFLPHHKNTTQGLTQNDQKNKTKDFLNAVSYKKSRQSSSIHYHIQHFLLSLFSWPFQRQQISNKFVPKPKLQCKPYLKNPNVSLKVRMRNVNGIYTQTKPKQANINPYFKHFSVSIEYRIWDLLLWCYRTHTWIFKKMCVCVHVHFLRYIHIIIEIYRKKSVKSSVFCIYLFTLNFLWTLRIILSHMDTVKLP